MSTDSTRSQESASAYVVRVEAPDPNTPITLGDRETLTERTVVGYLHANWQLLAEETVTGTPGTAAEIAEAALSNQTVAEPHSQIRVRVWEGVNSDTSTEPAAEVYSES